jgi:Na+/H+ antiporter NhaD/arsenite permease-like protein
MASISSLMLAPFGLLLAAIALGPLWFPTWWTRHYPKLVCVLAAIVVLYYVFALKATGEVGATLHEYVSFIVLIGSLFVVSSGIHIKMEGQASPVANIFFLLFGAVAANLFGTTGASILLIRPWLAMNKTRTTGCHVVFFIFIVSNVGGCLTPIGDPPLFLGYLNGVPFWWLARHCLSMWCAAVGLLLAIFFVIDYRNYLQVPQNVRVKLASPRHWRFRGGRNFLFLAVILGASMIRHPLFLPEGLMLAAALASYYTADQSVHASNRFSLKPLREVAILFAGLFATMIPALDWLQVNAAHLGPITPGFLYYGSGGLSSVLDSAPTYLCFLKALCALNPAHQPFAGDRVQIAYMLNDVKYSTYLIAISMGAVFFGAATYIGNGPNFMVKAIAEEEKVPCPDFLKYIFKYTIPFLIPVLVALWWLFFHG